MTEAEIRAMIVEALHKTANVFSDPSISDRLKDPGGEVSIDELKIDSLDRVEWCLEIESRTGLSIDPAEVAAARSLAEVARLVAGKLAERA